ncbi:MAG: hypothetical protein D6733_03115 [Methanobacteriota archaeon]|nr:MAG: hypothetical protein D6733_03115 [Euryarchaeota archaeon]
MDLGKTVQICMVLLIFSAAPVFGQGFQAERVWTFASPDSSYEAFSMFLDSVDSALYISVYELDSPLLARGIEGLLREGKNVTILVEDMPAGGFPREEADLLSALESAGARVYLSGGDLRFYHAKYAVSDNDTVLIGTENLGGNGYPPTGTSGNRGWGVIIGDAGLAEYFASLFYRDLRGAEPFVAPGTTAKEHGEPRPYTPVFGVREYRGSFAVRPVVAPDDAVESIVSLLQSANSSVYVEQFYIYKYWGGRAAGSVEETPNPFLEAAIDAARRGVKVRILLDDTWYNTEEDDPVSNYNTAIYVNEVARREGLDLEARLIDSEALGIEKLHAKGVVVDGKAALVSSVNWNENSPVNNREVGVIIVGEPAGYYADVFEHDWKAAEPDGRSPYPALVVILGGAAAIYLWRKRRGVEAG